MKKLVLFLCCLFNISIIFSQNIPQEYYTLTKKADSLYKLKEYKNSAFTYSAAFKANNWKGMMHHRYKAACSWSLANYPDSAFFQLYILANKMNFKHYDDVLNDEDFIPLHTDTRWSPLLDLVKKNADADLNIALMAQLDSIYYNDSNDRILEEEEVKKYGYNSKEVKDRWRIIHNKDSINLLKVTSILDTYGWLGATTVGKQGNQALFLSIQHAPLKTQEKYLPMLKEAVYKGNASNEDLVLLQDRIAIRQGKKQIYGSQVTQDTDGSYFLSPLEDPDNVDKRRASIGLGPLANYLHNWQLKWNVEQYKKDLPGIEAKLKATKR